MATERTKVYEDGKRAGIPVWAWLLPVLLLAALLAWYLLHPRTTPPATSAAVPAAVAPSAGGMPDLGSVHFATDSADLTPEGRATLARAADYMKQNPAVHLRLEGFTDATGTSPHNESLSQRRSLAAAQFLKDQGVDGSKLTGQGFGPQNPVDTNETQSGKADNRRVELFQQQQQ